MDVDIPTRLESKMFNYTLLRVLWLFLYPLNQAIRPYYKSPLPVNIYEIYNWLIQVSLNVFIYYVFGEKIVFYLLGGTLVSLGIHPLSGHFISEHYLFKDGHHATYSYYGPLNFILFNAGYHVEHHDFPYIPCTRIAKVRELAPKYYAIPHHTSWLRVLWDFIFDPEMGPQSRGVGYVAGDESLEQHADHFLEKLPIGKRLEEKGELCNKNNVIQNDAIKSFVSQNGTFQNDLTYRFKSVSNHGNVRQSKLLVKEIDNYHRLIFDIFYILYVVCMILFVYFYHA